jgi:hypothetical protein
MHGTQHSESTKALVPFFFLSIVVSGDDTFSILSYAVISIHSLLYT